MSATRSQFSLVPTEADAKLARQSKEVLSRHVSARRPLDLGSVSFRRGPAIKIPASAANLLVRVLDEMSRGNAVRLVPVNAQLTTQQAADLLNISRPTLIRLLDEGHIAFHKVGAHRRISTSSALKFKRRTDKESRSALAELAAYDQELGI